MFAQNHKKLTSLVCKCPLWFNLLDRVETPSISKNLS